MVRTSSSSSMDRNRYTHHSASYRSENDLNTDLRLGLNPDTCHEDFFSNARDDYCDWPPIQSSRRSIHSLENEDETTFFVKVYRDGIPIGRKLDLLKFDGYDSLLKSLQHMFRTNILCSDMASASSNRDCVLIYEDKEGDWMLVGDVPWEMFLTTVKKMRIIATDRG